MLTYCKISKTITKYFYQNGELTYEFKIFHHPDKMGEVEFAFEDRDDMAFKNFIYALIDEYNRSQKTDLYSQLEADIVSSSKK